MEPTGKPRKRTGIPSQKVLIEPPVPGSDTSQIRETEGEVKKSKDWREKGVGFFVNWEKKLDEKMPHFHFHTGQSYAAKSRMIEQGMPYLYSPL